MAKSNKSGSAKSIGAAAKSATSQKAVLPGTGSSQPNLKRASSTSRTRFSGGNQGPIHLGGKP
jgi:hypothetical protein